MNVSTESRRKKNAWRKGNLQILGNIGSRHHQKSGDDRKFLKKYFRRTRKLLETKLHSRNLIKGINTLAVPLVRYSRTFMKRTREKLKQMDQRTRKLMTIHKSLHPRLYMSIKEGGSGFASIQESVDASRLLRKARRKTDYSHQKQY